MTPCSTAGSKAAKDRKHLKNDRPALKPNVAAIYVANGLNNGSVRMHIGAHFVHHEVMSYLSAIADLTGGIEVIEFFEDKQLIVLVPKNPHKSEPTLKRLFTCFSRKLQAWYDSLDDQDFYRLTDRQASAWRRNQAMETHAHVGDSSIFD